MPRINVLQFVWVPVVGTLFFAFVSTGYAATAIIQPIVAATVPTTNAPNSNWFTDISNDCANAKEIQFDSVLTGADSGKSVPPIEISGVFSHPKSMNVIIVKNGMVACQIVSNGESGIAYCPATKRYLSFYPGEVNPDGTLMNPPMFAKTEVAEFIIDQVGTYSEGSFVFVTLAAQRLHGLINGLWAGDPKTIDTAWNLTESTASSVTTEHAAVSLKSLLAGLNATQTFNIDYTKKPESLTHVSFSMTASDKKLNGSADVVFKRFDIVTDPTKLSDPLTFLFVVPSDSIAWVPPSH